MSLRHKPLDFISEQDLADLVQNGVPETRDLEYKQALPGNSDSGKREFLADVSSLANASGGDLVIGVREEEGVAVDVTGVEVRSLDAEKLRLENIIRDGVQPRILRNR